MGKLQLFDLFKARLSRRIVFWVFASIIVIEGIILVPSVYRREKELLEYLEIISAAKASGILESRDLEVDGDRLLTYVRAVQTNSVVLGGALYQTDGTLVGTFGEPPDLTFSDVQTRRQVRLLNRENARYDSVWEMSPLDGRYMLIIRHDATEVRSEFFAFIGRITGLVIIISIFVTVATLIVLDRILISPIMTLRRDLLDAGPALSHGDSIEALPEFQSVKAQWADELGDVSTAFEQMVQQIAEANAMRQQAEHELRLSEEKFSKAFHSSPNPVTISTLDDGRLLDVNESFLSLFGITLEQAVGHTVTELKLWANPGDRPQMIDDLLREGFVRNREYPFRTAAGEIRTVLYSAEQILINGHLCLLSVLNDITERQQAEAAVRESEMRFRTLVEQAVDAFFVVNAAGSIVDVNQQACANLGYAREELLALSVPDISTEITLNQFHRLRQQLAPGHPVTIEGRHRRKDGSVFPVEVRLGLLDYGGEPLILALARDISERKQAEKVQARLAEIGELASMIVHEVRNPLTTVLMGLSSLKRLNLPERAKVRLELAMDESERLQRLLNEILMYAREQKLEATELDLNLLFAELLESLREMPLAYNRHIQFLPASGPARVQGDRDKLKQVFINLISNACEAIPPGERVDCQISCEQDQSVVTVRVRNGGDPIPPDVLPQLTQPFFTTKSSGNGLGLAITKRIVEAHQGTLLIESSAEQGTTVVVSLPAAIGGDRTTA